jgi:ERCC4-related helicase
VSVFTPGMRVLCRDAEWLVTRVESASQTQQEQTVYCLGADDLVRGHQAAFLTQIDSIIPVDPRKTKLVRDESGSYSQSKLFLEAQLRQMPLTDPEPDFESMGAFKPMEFQKEAVRRAVAQMRPRLLLADAVGLGKTIEVGMILSELIKRGQGDRILVLAKKSMLTQFQAELWNRFAIPLVRLDSIGLQRVQLKIPASKNPFEVYHRIIMSIDTLKDIGRYSHFLEDTRWDCVVIDEAHNVAGATNPERNLSYRLARRLSRRSNSMILTTATPHNGKKETFGRLINLLDPSAIPDPKLQEYKAADIKPFFLMRFKEDVRKEAGDNFSERLVVPPRDTTVIASDEEAPVYQLLSSLRHQILDKSLKGNAIVQWGMYKSYLSSPEACLSTARKRLKGLTKRPEKSAEEGQLKKLVALLEKQPIQQSSRFELLLQQLKDLAWNGKSASPRVLVFTESRVTQDALIKALTNHFSIPFSTNQEDQANQIVAMAHGGMSDVTLGKTVESFGTGTSKMRMMIATDVASEGVNLHHECHNIIHYDLPWSIITLIQRNGRIDRFGQTNSPVIRYLMVESDEGLLKGDSELFERLVGKVEEINRTTRTGESVMKLYSPEKEEEFIGKSLIAGETDALDKKTGWDSEAAGLEALLQEANAGGHDDYLAGLLGESKADLSNNIDEKSLDSSRVRLMSHQDFLQQGYAQLSVVFADARFQPLQNTGQQILITPPPELRRRLGDPKAQDSVLFGATSIPEEAWPEDGQLRVTNSVERVNTAIRAALAQKNQWSEELLLTEQHPVMQWLAERLMMLMERGQAPLIASPHLEAGELLFCFIGQVSSRAGTPLIVDPHAVSFKKGGRFEIKPLQSALAEVNFQQLANIGAAGDLPKNLLEGFVEGAVEQSIFHLKQLKDKRRALILPRLEEEKKRLQGWFQEWGGHIQQALMKLPQEGKQATRLRQQLDEMQKYLIDREENWEQAHYRAVDEPITRLVLAVEGIKT